MSVYSYVTIMVSYTYVIMYAKSACRKWSAGGNDVITFCCGLSWEVNETCQDVCCERKSNSVVHCGKVKDGIPLQVMPPNWKVKDAWNPSASYAA